MGKYADHITLGGQVLAHRFRMMAQNWNIIWIIGRLSFVISFILYLTIKWNFIYIWNYLCCLKAWFRTSLTTLPHKFFISSYLLKTSGIFVEFSDYFLVTNPEALCFKNKFEDSLIFNLKLSFAVAIISMIITILFTKYFGKSLRDNNEVVLGHNYLEGKAIAKLIKFKSDITLADIPYPEGTECKHTIITGTTGSGKTNVFHELIDQVINKNERAIIVDTVGTYVHNYYKPDRDIIINPLDYRSMPWNFLNECGSNTVLIKDVADCLIDDTGSYDKFWDQAAKVVFTETVKKVLLKGRTTKDLLNMLKRPTIE